MIGRPPRIGVSLLLLLSLLGLSASDAAVCWGADGHVGLENRFNSCCHGEAAEGAPAASGGSSHLADLDGDCGDGACDDLPVIQGTPTARASHAAPPCLAAVTIDPPRVVAPLAPATTHPAATAPHLERLRTTTLLI